MKSKRSQLLESVSERITDYRESEIPQRSPQVVERWVNQFPEEHRTTILEEMEHILHTSYISRRKAEVALRRLPETVLLSHPDERGRREFWESTGILQIQQRGHSQRELLSILSEENQISLQGDDPAASTAWTRHLYVDDFMFSGGRVCEDIRCWIERDAPSECNLIVFTLAAYTGARIRLELEIQRGCKSAGKRINYHFCHLSEIRQSSKAPERSNTLWPTSVPDTPEARVHMAELAKKGRAPTLRPDVDTGTLVFSSEGSRRLLEEQFLLAGISIKASSPNLPGHFGPLGAASPNPAVEKFGFGATMLSYRNCPNTCPLCWWVEDKDWFPLFPRIIN